MTRLHALIARLRGRRRNPTRTAAPSFRIALDAHVGDKDKFQALVDRWAQRANIDDEWQEY